MLLLATNKCDRLTYQKTEVHAIETLSNYLIDSKSKQSVTIIYRIEMILKGL